MIRRLFGCLLVASLPLLPTAQADAQNVLASGEALSADQSRTSSSGRYTLYYQADGNLVLLDNQSGPVWDSSTFSSPGATVMQGDGNLVVYDEWGTPLWASNTNGHDGAYLEVHDAGAIVLRNPQGAAIWAEPFMPAAPPATQPIVLLINGSFADSPAGWTAPGSPQFNAIAATYGVSPEPWPWTSNGLTDVTAPYNGILDGGFELANFLGSLPAGEVNIISHSHGGNVVLASQIWSSRMLRRYIQLATPVNWDFGELRYAIGYTVQGRCQVSSDADWVQFFGASRGQITNWAIAMYAEHAGSQQAYDALLRGDYAEALAWFAGAAFAAWAADYWFWTTKEEVEGDNWVFQGWGLGHSAMHEPFVWNAIAPYCK